MAGLNYGQEIFSKVRVCGMECGFNDMRIDRGNVPEGRYRYEAAGDDDSGGEPVRVRRGILAGFFGTLICDKPLPAGNDGVLWLKDGDFVWL